MPTPSYIKILSDTQFTAPISATQGFDLNNINALSASIPEVTLTNVYAAEPANPITVHSDLIIQGTLSATGQTNLTNTVFETTSAIVVHNYGTGPALSVSQEGENAIAAFYDHESTIALWVDGTTERPGFVGIKTDTPNVELTVSGNISASGMIYGRHDLSTSWKGVYNSGTQYVDSDIVTYNGSTYICVLANDGSNNVDGNGNYYISNKNPETYNVDQAVGANDKNWQVLSPTGDTGETGVQGATGETGVQGATGETGVQGATGETGVQGSTGETGVQGATGETGVQGATGETGVQGSTGETGVQGATGETGVQGATGETGVQGSTGETGVQGSTGETGVQGATGETGVQGSTGETGVQGSTGETGVQGSTGETGVQGSTGETGVQGSTGETGVQGSTGETGVQGSTGETGVQGATGETGVQGATGETGVQGSTGETGVQGATGETGVQGATGETGVQGATGETGVQGATGETGVQGATGETGVQGSTGETGVQGATGETGVQGATGETGVQGSTGETGVQGATGETGVQGATGETGVQGATGETGVQGATGETGVQGSTGETGVQGSTGETGVRGAPGATGPTYEISVGTVSAVAGITIPIITSANAGAYDRVYNFTFPLWNRKYSETIGNGINTSFTISHTIASPDVIISVRDLATKEIVIPSLVVTDANVVTVAFAEPPDNDQYRVTVIG